MKKTNDIKNHEAVLREKIFFTETKWPQYNLLFNDIKALASMPLIRSSVFSYERNLLYGGCSLLAPFFYAHSYYVEECTRLDRGATAAVDDSRLIITRLESYNHEPIHMVIVPNAVHHMPDQSKFFDKIVEKTSRYVYIFEPLVREIHQAPYDYVRYTPYGLKEMLEGRGMKIVWEHEIGGPFTTLAYVFDQCLQYLPESEREEIKFEFALEEDIFNIVQAIKMDKACPKNLVREHSRFPTAMSVLAEKC